MKRKTTAEFIEQSKSIHGDKYDYSEVKYCGWNIPVKIICLTCKTIFDQRPNDHTNHHGCPTCNNVKKLTNETFINKSELIHNKKYNYSKVFYINNHTDVCIICPNHGDFWQKPYSHLQRHGCKKCNDEKKILGTNEFLKKFRKIHGNRYDYSKVEYKHSNEKIEIICKTHGSFWQNSYQHSCGSGCSKCYETKHKVSNNDFIHRCVKIHGSTYDYSFTKYKHPKFKVKIICKKHGPFNQFPFGHLSGQGCKKCTSNISKKEIKFLDFYNISEENR